MRNTILKSRTNGKHRGEDLMAHAKPVRMETNRPTMHTSPSPPPPEPELVVATPREVELLNRIGRLERKVSECRGQVAGKDLVCVMPVSKNDVGLAVECLEWQAELGGHPDHTCLIWTPASMSERLVKTLVDAAEGAWGGVEHGSTPFDLSKEGWPQGANWMFATASQWCHKRQLDFMVLEPDATPLKPGWFTEIVGEFRRCGRPYMGTVEEPGPQHPRHMPGNAVYSWDVFEKDTARALYIPWDVLLAQDGIMDYVAETKRIQQVWGANNKPPTFPDHASLKIIKPGAVVFHRCKDGSLIRQLKATR